MNKARILALRPPQATRLLLADPSPASRPLPCYRLSPNK